MNLDQIAARIAAPQTCQPDEINALEALTVKYPYAQVFSILYLKALANQKDIHFEEALHQHAYKITDRMKLYDLIHAEAALPVTELLEHEFEETASIEIPETQPVAEEDFVENASFEETQDEIPMIALESLEEIQNEIVELEAEILPQESESEALTVSDSDSDRFSESITLEEEEESSSEEALGDDELELEIISHVVATVYNDNLEKSVPEIEAVEKKIENTSVESIDEKQEEISVPTDAPKTFTGWLRAGSQSSVRTEIKVETKVESTEKQVDKIIDKFIEEEPSISRPKKEFYSPSKKAKESVSEEGLIYTETLASIFAIQGNFPKAILAYEQLMLTNPEKKIFFAQRIEELKEKLKT